MTYTSAKLGELSRTDLRIIAVREFNMSNKIVVSTKTATLISLILACQKSACVHDYVQKTTEMIANLLGRSHELSKENEILKETMVKDKTAYEEISSWTSATLDILKRHGVSNPNRKRA